MAWYRRSSIPSCTPSVEPTSTKIRSPSIFSTVRRSRARAGPAATSSNATADATAKIMMRSLMSELQRDVAAGGGAAEAFVARLVAAAQADPQAALHRVGHVVDEPHGRVAVGGGVVGDLDGRRHREVGDRVPAEADEGVEPGLGDVLEAEGDVRAELGARAQLHPPAEAEGGPGRGHDAPHVGIDQRGDPQPHL